MLTCLLFANRTVKQRFVFGVIPLLRPPLPHCCWTRFAACRLWISPAWGSRCSLSTRLRRVRRSAGLCSDRPLWRAGRIPSRACWLVLRTPSSSWAASRTSARAGCSATVRPWAFCSGPWLPWSGRRGCWSHWRASSSCPSWCTTPSFWCSQSPACSSASASWSPLLHARNWQSSVPLHSVLCLADRESFLFDFGAVNPMRRLWGLSK